MHLINSYTLLLWENMYVGMEDRDSDNGDFEPLARTK